MSKKEFHPKRYHGLRWIKATSGATYICPSDLDAGSLSEAQLKKHCVDESHNPQNS
ncbi:MAG: hypothetical protein JSW50_06545 [Candidatus Latescibacterota bacterium]|nr:MAG: hypothetical protein JSW50_06545 [Candidatus Latescibacterota bacterium]